MNYLSIPDVRLGHISHACLDPRKKVLISGSSAFLNQTLFPFETCHDSPQGHCDE